MGMYKFFSEVKQKFVSNLPDISMGAGILCFMIGMIDQVRRSNSLDETNTGDLIAMGTGAASAIIGGLVKTRCLSGEDEEQDQGYVAIASSGEQKEPREAKVEIEIEEVEKPQDEKQDSTKLGM